MLHISREAEVEYFFHKLVSTNLVCLIFFQFHFSCIFYWSFANELILLLFIITCDVYVRNISVFLFQWYVIQYLQIIDYLNN